LNTGTTVASHLGHPRHWSKVANAYQYSQEGLGSRSPNADFESLADNLDVELWDTVWEKRQAAKVAVGGGTVVDLAAYREAKEATTAGIKATPYRWIDPSDIAPRDWLYGRHLARKFTSATIAAPGIGKSSLVLVESLALSSGRDLLDAGSRVRPCKVWYWNGEDPYDELQRRIQAICKHYGIKKEDIEGRFFVDSGRTTPIVIATETRNGATIAEPVVEAVKATIRENGIDVFTLDPFVSCHRVSENDNNKIEAVAWEWAKIADECNCAVEKVHHGRKTNGAEMTVEDSRGGSALIGKVRSARVINRMTEDEGKRARVEDHRLHFRVDDGKPSMARPSKSATWYKLASVGLANANGRRPQDEVGVVVSWQWPEALDGLRDDALMKAQKSIEALGTPRRHSSQAGDWAGKVIGPAIGIDIETEAGKRQVQGAIDAWIKSGDFEKYQERDRKGMAREFIRPIWKGTAGVNSTPPHP
jgi:hypothetical protein